MVSLIDCLRNDFAKLMNTVCTLVLTFVIHLPN